MSELILTGFHAVEERVRNAYANKDTVSSMQIFYSKPGPRIKKILEQAKKAGIAYSQTDDKTLDDEPIPPLKPWHFIPQPAPISHPQRPKDR